MGFKVSFRIAATGIVVLCSAALTPIGDRSPQPDFGNPWRACPPTSSTGSTTGRRSSRESKRSRRALGQ